MGDFAELMEEVERLEYPHAIQRLNSYVYDTLEEQRKGSCGRITTDTMKIVKKVMDYIAQKTLTAYRITIENEVKLKAMIENNRVFEDLANKIARVSTGASDDQQKKSKIDRLRDRDDYSVILTSAVDEDVEDVRSIVKMACREAEEIPRIGDIVTTKQKQVILKVKSREETVKLQKLLTSSEKTKDRIKVTIPRKRRERIMVLSVDKEIDEQCVTGTISKLLEEEKVGTGMMDGIREKLNDGSVTGQAKITLEKLVDEFRYDVNVIRRIETKAGKVNWLLDVDKDSMEFLILRRRICLDCERYRVVEYIPIVRCYKCQAYGHVANVCKGALRCPKCADSHMVTECKSVKLTCSNCYFGGSEADTNHSADSPSCPVFKAYRDQWIPKRL